MNIKDLAALFQAIAVSALLGINAWRRQLIGGKRAEVAERTLIGFYEARDIFESARSPASIEGEGRTRQRAPGETEAEARYRDAIYAPAERLMNEREFFMAINASRYRFMAYFGRDAEVPFKAIFKARHRVMGSVRMLVTTDFGPMRPEDVKLKSQWERDIWAIGTMDDPIKRDVDKAVADIEAFCRPVLEARPDQGWRTHWRKTRTFASRIFKKWFRSP